MENTYAQCVAARPITPPPPIPWYIWIYLHLQQIGVYSDSAVAIKIIKPSNFMNVTPLESVYYVSKFQANNIKTPPFPVKLASMDVTLVRLVW